jgi:hypothetical protein
MWSIRDADRASTPSLRQLVTNRQITLQVSEFWADYGLYEVTLLLDRLAG